MAKLQITISIPAQTLDVWAAAAMGYLPDEFDTDAFKLAGLSLKQLTKDVKADPTFLKNVTSMVQDYVADNEDYLSDRIYDIEAISIVKKAKVALQKAQDQLDEEGRADEKAQRVKNAIELVKKAGYTVNKGWQLG